MIPKQDQGERPRLLLRHRAAHKPAGAWGSKQLDRNDTTTTTTTTTDDNNTQTGSGGLRINPLAHGNRNSSM